MRGKTQELPNTSRAVTRREANIRGKKHIRGAALVTRIVVIITVMMRGETLK